MKNSFGSGCRDILIMRVRSKELGSNRGRFEKRYLYAIIDQVLRSI